MKKRQEQMKKWAVKNLPKWPVCPTMTEADPSEISCSFIFLHGIDALPVLSCNFGGGDVSSTDWFYAKRSKKFKDQP